ncbi:hypothetical protein BKA65DRAFT_510248 [Rhexocercosporidium sp. MPI-PUGE-AT-0058]|nr:hypothetical protein BKA65DRAFT_510248 [Rhexocercosporidium sp. MPI-PUGE-AT-0058]
MLQPLSDAHQISQTFGYNFAPSSWLSRNCYFLQYSRHPFQILTCFSKIFFDSTNIHHQSQDTLAIPLATRNIKTTSSFPQSTYLTYRMSPRFIKSYASSVIDDLELRLDASIDRALTQVKFRSHPRQVVQVIDQVYNKLIVNANKAVDKMIPTLGYELAMIIVAVAEARMLQDVGLLEQELAEIAMFGRASKYSNSHLLVSQLILSGNPYIPGKKYNPYLPSSRPHNFAKCDGAYCGYPHDKPKKTAPAAKPTPGTGPGPTPVPQKTKSKGKAAWEDQQSNTTWGDSQNWEDLALHTASKERLEAEDRAKAEESPNTENNLKAGKDVKAKKPKA